MTTISSSHGPTEVINARRTESLDAPAISDLASGRTMQQFGNVNIVHLIEKANLAVTLINEENEVLGFAGFLDYPSQTPDVCSPTNWQEWISDCGYTGAEKSTPLNSLFLHYFVAKSDYTIGCATEIIRTVFNAVPDLHFLLLVLPSNAMPEQAIEQIFHPIEGTKSDDKYMLYGCHRHDHVPVLHVRQAVMEDSDDLTPIFTRLNEKLPETYGEHFLAEMIEAHEEDKYALVAEVGGKAIGFISMSNEVNIDLLQKEYEISPFHGLKKPHPNDKLVEPRPAEEPTENHDDTSALNTEENEDHTPQAEESSPEVASEESNTEVDAEASNLEETDALPDEQPDTKEGYYIPNRESTPEITPEFEPEYYGESNCFSIQLFCIDELHEMRSADFLPHVFKLFPGKEFAVITVPHLVPEFPLLQHFVRATPKNSMLVSQELYVFHRGGLFHDFTVVKVVTDLNADVDILKDVDIFNAARRDDDGTEVQAFVAESLGQVVGVAVVRREEDIEYIRSHYNIEDFIYFNHHRRHEHGHLHHFCLNPVFQHYTKQFFKEILRQGQKSCLFYPVEKGINYLVPVRARRQIVYPKQELKENAPSERVTQKLRPYALYHMNRKLTLEPKVTINARIVVVGASSVGISFLETLSFCPHLRFNNLTLIAKDGFPDKICSADYSYTEDQLASMSLSTWVNVVKGSMVGIERSHKYVILENGERVSYDYLMLCTGQQYQVPKPTEADLDAGATNRDISHRAIETPYLRQLPMNVMAINKDCDEKFLTEWMSNTKTFHGKIVIYGNSLDAYFTIQNLLSLGVSGEKLVLLQPPTSHKVTQPDTFQEPGLVKAVTQALTNAGVECIDHLTFRAVNDACLVFDGRLVIDANFCTNDRSIRAAGSLTKYARRYHAENWSNHDGYNSCEIGFRLAMSVLPTFDPTLESMAEQQDNPHDPYTKLTPTFTDCKVFHGILPGGLEYLHIRKPGAAQPYGMQIAHASHGKEIETGSVENGDYFRLHVNEQNCVETITCVVNVDDKDAIPISNYIQLFDIHERYLNNLVDRFDEGLITDLFAFFKEPWAMAIFHDRFRDLRHEVREILSMQPDGGENLPSMESEAEKIFQEDQKITVQQMTDLRNYYTTVGMRRTVENRLLSFLSYNYYHLPMYAKPGMV